MSTRRFKPGFIEEETDYTRGNVVPGAAPVPAEEPVLEGETDGPLVSGKRPIAPEPASPRSGNGPPSRSRKAKAEPATAEGTDPAPCRCIVRFALDVDTTARLDAVAREVGQDASVILGQLRKGVVAGLHETLAAGQRPNDAGSGATAGGGAKVRVNFTLAGEEHARARAWFDPLGIGDHAMRENMIPTLARLYRDRIRELRTA